MATLQDVSDAMDRLGDAALSVKEERDQLSADLAESTKYGTPEEIIACMLETVRAGVLGLPLPLAGGDVIDYLDGPAHKDVVEALAKRAEARRNERTPR